MFMSVFSFVVAGAGDSFITVVLVSFFSAGGVTVVSFCSQAANNAMPATRQMYFFITTNRISEETLAVSSGVLLPAPQRYTKHVQTGKDADS